MFAPGRLGLTVSHSLGSKAQGGTSSRGASVPRRCTAQGNLFPPCSLRSGGLRKNSLVPFSLLEGTDLKLAQDCWLKCKMFFAES